MTKLYLSCYIAGTLFDMPGLAPVDNWKVKELMRRPKSDLEYHYRNAKQARFDRETLAL